MVEIVNKDNPNDTSAFITIAFIIHTEKIESTHTIVDLWDEIRNNMKLDNNVNLISAILATGRVLDLKHQLRKEDFLKFQDELILSIGPHLENKKMSTEINDSDFVSALITASYVAHSSEIETIKMIIDNWEKINNTFNIKDDIDKLAGILTIGRILESKTDTNTIEHIYDAFDRIRKTLTGLLGKEEVEQKDIAAAFLTGAHVTNTPKMESINDFIQIWDGLRNKLAFDDHIDYISTILTSGQIVDIDGNIFFSDKNISNIKTSIKECIQIKMEKDI